MLMWTWRKAYNDRKWFAKEKKRIEEEERVARKAARDERQRQQVEDDQARLTMAVASLSLTGAAQSTSTSAYSSTSGPLRSITQCAQVICTKKGNKDCKQKMCRDHCMKIMATEGKNTGKMGCGYAGHLDS